MQQRELQERVIQTSEDIRLVRAAFSLYWNVRLDTQGGRLDRDDAGPRRAESVSAPWTVDRLNQMHAALRTLPEADVRSGAFQRLTLEANSGGGSFQNDRRASTYGQFQIGADVSDRRVPAHFLMVAAATGQTQLQLDAVDGLDAGHTVSIRSGASVEQGTVASVDAAARTVTLARALLRNQAVGANVDAQVTSSEEYRTTGIQLSRDTAAGATSVVLSELGSLATGDVVMVGVGSDGGERRTLGSVDAATRTITFDAPLLRAHFQTDRVAVARMPEVARTLAAAAGAGSTTLVVSSVFGLEPGVDLLIAPGTPAQERVRVQAANSATSTLTLAAPLSGAHASSTPLERVSPAAGYRITANVHQRAHTLVLNDVSNLNPQTMLMIDEGGPHNTPTTVVSVDAATRTVTIDTDLDYDHPGGTTLAPVRGYVSHEVVDATLVGGTSLGLNTIVNLHAGDRITLGRNTALEEAVVIRSIVAVTRTLTLTAGLTRAHPARTTLGLPEWRELSAGWLSGVVRHEIAHAVDEVLGASGTREFKQTIGGWRESTNFEAWAAQMGDPWHTNSGAVISAAERAGIKARIVARMQVSGAQALDQGLAASHPIRRY